MTLNCFVHTILYKNLRVTITHTDTVFNQLQSSFRRIRLEKGQDMVSSSRRNLRRLLLDNHSLNSITVRDDHEALEGAPRSTSNPSCIWE